MGDIWEEWAQIKNWGLNRWFKLATKGSILGREIYQMEILVLKLKEIEIIPQNKVLGQHIWGLLNIVDPRQQDQKLRNHWAHGLRHQKDPHKHNRNSKNHNSVKEFFIMAEIIQIIKTKRWKNKVKPNHFWKCSFRKKI